MFIDNKDEFVYLLGVVQGSKNQKSVDHFSLDDTLQEVLVHNKAEFVYLFLEIGANLKTFLTEHSSRLYDLYRKVRLCFFLFNPLSSPSPSKPAKLPALSGNTRNFISSPAYLRKVNYYHPPTMNIFHFGPPALPVLFKVQV